MLTVDIFRPDLIDYKSTLIKSPKERMEQAFTVAEKELGIARLLEPEGKSRGLFKTRLNIYNGVFTIFSKKLHRRYSTEF